MLKTSANSEILKKHVADFDTGIQCLDGCDARNHASSDETVLCEYGPEETAKLDAVLDSVNRLIESLANDLDEGAVNERHDQPGDDAVNLLCEYIADKASAETTNNRQKPANTVCYPGASKQCEERSYDKDCPAASLRNGYQYPKSQSDCVAKKILRERTLPDNILREFEFSVPATDDEKRTCADQGKSPQTYKVPDERSPTSFDQKRQAHSLGTDFRFNREPQEAVESETKFSSNFSSSNAASARHQADSRSCSRYLSLPTEEPSSEHSKCKGKNVSDDKVQQVDKDRTVKPSLEAKVLLRKTALNRDVTWTAPCCIDPETNEVETSSKASNSLLTSFTGSGPFKFAQHILTGYKGKRKLSATKSSPASTTVRERNFVLELQSCKRSPSPSPTIPCKNIVEPNPSLLSRATNNSIGTDFGTWSKKKFKHRSLKRHFRNCTSLEESQKSNSVDSAAADISDTLPVEPFVTGKTKPRNSPTSARTSFRSQPFEALRETSGSLFRSSERRKKAQTNLQSEEKRDCGSAEMNVQARAGCPLLVCSPTIACCDHVAGKTTNIDSTIQSDNCFLETAGKELIYIWKERFICDFSKTYVACHSELIFKHFVAQAKQCLFRETLYKQQIVNSCVGSHQREFHYFYLFIVTKRGQKPHCRKTFEEWLYYLIFCVREKLL